MDEKLLTELDKFSSPVLAKDRPLFPKIEIFGHYKIGKTVLACRIGRRPFLIASDPSWTAIKDWMPGPGGVDLSNVEVVDYQGLKHIKTLAQAFKEDVPKYREFDTIILDPFSKMIDEYLDWLVDVYKPSQADSRVYWNPTKPTPGAETFTTSGMGDYNAVRRAFRPTVYDYCKLNRTVVFVCHVKEPGITDTPASRVVRASLPGKTHEMLAREVDALGYMEADKGKRTLSFKPSKKEDIGSRIRALHERVIDADEFPEILEKWTAGTL